MFIGGFENSDAFKNLFSSISDKFASIFNANIPFLNDALRYVIQFFNYLSRPIIWLSSYSGLRAEVVMVIIGLITGGIGMIIGSFLIKTIVKWWSALVP